ncbi:MAG: hypothetical protein ACRDPS_10100 [Nocardioides sp.]|uniref:hypothetical protein n=1 Tax=Nocardioides sp. TaxID=35761 RepID=UPI003D6C2FB0
MTYVPPVELLGGEITGSTLPAILGLTAIVLIFFAFMARSSTPASSGFVLDAGPGSTIVYSLGSHDAKRCARKARARSRHLGENETFAVLVRPDAFEIWGYGDTAPRWTIERAKAEIQTVGVLVKIDYWTDGIPFRREYEPGVRISDGKRAIHIIPAGSAIRGTPVESVLRALHS